MKTLVIGTRGSPLALWQARHVQKRLIDAHGLAPEQVLIKVLKTSGDRLKGALAEFGGKGLFTRELEEALIDRRIDMAVHSMKDVPTVGQEALAIGAILEREDPRDAFISPSVSALMDLPVGALLGTASIRRRAQLSRLRPDIKYTLLRGNVGTRLDKLAQGVCDATFLACAGLNRLGQADVMTQAVPTDLMLPAPAQGAIGIEIRRADAALVEILAPLNHARTQLSITAERAFLEALDGSCRTPIAALAEIRDGQIFFRGELLSPDGTEHFTRSAKAALPAMDAAYNLGYDLGRDIRAEIGERPIWESA